MSTTPPLPPTPSGGWPPSRRSLLRAAVVAPLLAGAATAAPALSATAAPGDGYAMGYFTESPAGVANDYALHLAVSRDGLHWTPLNQNLAVAVPTAGTGGLRDPFILRKQDGTFVVLATDMRGTDFTQQNQFIHVWDSVDLRSFTGYRRLRLHDLPTHTWAPEAFYDPARGEYGIVYSAETGGRNKILVNYTRDFVTAGPYQVWFDPGFSVLDATIVPGSPPYLYYKRESDNSLLGARGASLAPGAFSTGTYTRSYASGATEAPIVVKANDSATWYLWGDSYAPANGEFFVWRSTDIRADAWVPLGNDQYTQPLNSKHATITSLSAAEVDALIARWGAPRWNRLKSSNFPDRYVRHSDFKVRLDPYPLDPFQDSQWRLVPGLADPAAVSFESVNVPGHFLRHTGFMVGLARDDGSAGLRADATFVRGPGLARAAWSSFRSWNFPDRYLRHSGFALRIDVLGTGSSASDRGDATFDVVF